MKQYSVRLGKPLELGETVRAGENLVVEAWELEAYKEFAKVLETFFREFTFSADHFSELEKEQSQAVASRATSVMRNEVLLWVAVNTQWKKE